MGIQGLLPFLDKVSTRVNIADYKNSCVAVDAYCWLHKGAYTCAEKLALGEKCDAYVFYCMKYVNMLLSHNIKPILVFDGRHLPAKAVTEKKRRESREANRKTATELIKTGRNDEARNYLRRCVDVTHKMALALIQECRKKNVDCIVAPYEADAQLAFLNLQNIAQVVITEDSDLILFGCSKVIFKLDLQGYGLLVEQDRLHMSMKVRAENFSLDSFRYMCILSGCDYLPSLPGIGLGKALKFINKTRDPDIHRALQRLPSYLNMTQLRVSEEYRDSFLHADATFRFQPVFDPRSRSIVPLTEPQDDEVPAIVNEKLPPSTALDLALGNLDPFTLERVDNFNPDCPRAGISALQRRNSTSSVSTMHPSIWASHFHGFNAPPEDHKFPGTFKKMALLDVTPLRPSKHAMESEEVPSDDLISQADLMTLYGNKQSTMQSLKRSCSDTNAVTVLDDNRFSSNCTDDDVKTSELSTEVVNHSTSSVLSERKSLNPFVKHKSAQATDVGPLGVVDRPHYFSALRKFDGYNPVGQDPITVVTSRTSNRIPLGSVTENENKKLEGNCDIITVSYHESTSLEEEFGNSQFINDKENVLNSRRQEKKSLLETMEEIDKEALMSNKLSIAHSPKQEENILVIKDDLNTDLKEKKTKSVETITEDMADIQANSTNARISAKPTSAFDWRQFVSPKVQSSPKLHTSLAANKTFKNPFRKLSSSDKIKRPTEEIRNICKLSAIVCESQSTPLHFDVLKSPCELSLSDEDVFRSQEDPEHGVHQNVSLEHSISSLSSIPSQINKVFKSPFCKKDSSIAKEMVEDDHKKKVSCKSPEAEFVLHSTLLKNSSLDTNTKDCPSGILQREENVGIDNLPNTSTSTCSENNEYVSESRTLKVGKRSIDETTEDIGPSEDSLWEQLRQQHPSDENDEGRDILSGGSADSGYTSLTDIQYSTLQSGGSLTSKQLSVSKRGKCIRGSPTSRRIGLGRSSAPSVASSKQNLLAQYGFSKKRKLTH